MQYQAYVYQIARGIYDKYNKHIEFQDLIQYGQLGLVEALENFDETRGIDFLTFAYKRIKGAIFDGLKECTETIKARSCRDKIRKVIKDMTYLDNNHADLNPTKAKIEKLKKLIRQLTQAYIISIDALPEASSTESPEQYCISNQLKENLHKAMSKLNQKQFLIIKYCYYDDMSIASAGAKIGICRSWAVRLHAQALETLYKEMCKFNKNE